MMRTLRALRVGSSIRRGSSWPIEVETDAGPCIVKLAGAGHGAAALVAEIIVAELAEAIGLNVPPRALVTIEPELPSENRDPELLELIRASAGINLGTLPVEGARDFAPGDEQYVPEDDASRIVWLDWWVMNPDRTPRSPNLLIRRGRLWLIDHGAALVFHHAWSGVTEDSPRRAWSLENHVLLPRATHLAEWDAVLKDTVTREMIDRSITEVPDAFLRPLVPDGSTEAIARRRAAYAAFLWKRVRSPLFTAERAEGARAREGGSR